MSEVVSGVAPIPALVYLSGPKRGSSEALRAGSIRVGTAPQAGIHLPPASDGAVGPHHATLERRGLTYRIVAQPGQAIWVNGERVEEMVLASGDVIEIGREGPVLRFRLYAAGSKMAKSMSEVFADCVDCARYGGESWLEKASILLLGVPVELATQTSFRFRASLVLLMAFLAIGVVSLARRTITIEERLAAELTRVEGLADMARRSAAQGITRDELEDLRTTLSEPVGAEPTASPEPFADSSVARSLAEATRRIAALEARVGAVPRLVSRVSSSVLFVQGGFGFVGPDGRPVRVVLGLGGQPVVNARGEPRVSLDGKGPPLEINFTGTAFLVGDEPLLVTNRHVAIPWESESAAQAMIQRGLEPVMRRLVVFVPGQEDPVPVELVRASDDADLAVLRTGRPLGREPLTLADAAAVTGDEVVVMGYPLGLRGLLARTDTAFVGGLIRGGEAMSFWDTARKLASAGHISPLASQGIVSQVNGSKVFFDAETTRGGSGGPVLTLNGQVVAVAHAIVPDFGGSNLAVPVSELRNLLEAAREP